MSTYNDFNLWKKEKAGELFKRDAEITHYYNNVMANGKWAHMMDQTHIGYTYWQQPDRNAMPAIQTIALPTAAEMGVAIEGATQWWPNEKNEAVLPAFDPYHQQVYYLEIFNRGQMPFEYSAQVEAPWIKIDKAKGKVGIEERLQVSIDWKSAPIGIRRVPITVTGPTIAESWCGPSSIILCLRSAMRSPALLRATAMFPSKLSITRARWIRLPPNGNAFRIWDAHFR